MCYNQLDRKLTTIQTMKSERTCGGIGGGIEN